jgi:hypothetical protein
MDPSEADGTAKRVALRRKANLEINGFEVGEIERSSGRPWA